MVFKVSSKLQQLLVAIKISANHLFLMRIYYFIGMNNNRVLRSYTNSEINANITNLIDDTMKPVY